MSRIRKTLTSAAVALLALLAAPGYSAEGSDQLPCGAGI